jgi:hypothetical protein
MTKPTKKSVEQFVKTKLATDRAWAVKALVKIYSMQTDEEKTIRTAKCLNGVGFGSYDADILTGLAKHYITKKFLTDGQMNIIFKRIPKYWKQIVGVSDRDKLYQLVTK